jgi:hypothetical protein
MKPLLITVCILLTMGAVAQDSNSVAVHKDPRIDLLVKKQIEINEITTRNARRTAQGYRILVINTNNRTKAVQAKTKIYKEFPELKAYLMYQPPFFKLKVGNFKEREEAEEYLVDIQRLFPTGVYVVRDIIEVRPEITNEQF